MYKVAHSKVHVAQIRKLPAKAFGKEKLSGWRKASVAEAF
jgi:hypothetical protein